MKVLIPKSSGFCPGVRRAEEGVLALRKSLPFVPLHGPLIHNQSHSEFLQARGIGAVAVDTLPEGSTLVIRTHGIPKGEEQALGAHFTLKDMTCPIVKRVQKKVEKADAEGAFVLISGKESHAEVQGLKSYARRCRVIEDETQLQAFLGEEPEGISKIFILSQTTHSRPFFLRLCEAIKAKFSCPIEVADTICPVTENKEQESLGLQKQADASIVIGDPHSSNSKKLYKILSDANARTYFIRTAADLASLSLEGVGTVLLVSSASTPQFIEDEARRLLEALPTPMGWDTFTRGSRPPLEQAVRVQCALLKKYHGDMPNASDFSDLLCKYTLRGKLLRGMFVHLAAFSFGTTSPGEAVFTAGACLELAQSAFLIHDDIMDRDDLRRGEPSMHTLIGTEPAICLGDLALLHIFQNLSFNPGLVNLFSRHLSATALGQALEIASAEEGEPSIEAILHIIRQKTARYTFVLPFEAGALLAGAEPNPALGELGMVLGEIFQVRDDELNLLSPEETGKSSGGDIRENKKTLCRAVLLQKYPEAAEFFGRADSFTQVKEAYEGSGAAEEIAAFLDGRLAGAEALLEALPIIEESRPLWGGLLSMLRRRKI